MNRDYYIVDLNLLEEINETENMFGVRKSKFYKHRGNPFEDFTEKEFKGKFSFSKHTSMFIINLIKNELVGDARGGRIPPYLQILTAIRIWARGEIQDDVADLSGMSQPTASLTCKRVALALVEKQGDFIKMPRTIQEQSKVMADFFSIYGFRQVIGCIDCTHIRIPKVSGNIGQYYGNHKGYSSLNVQVVSNAKFEIMDIVAHWRGSTQDSRIFNESSLKRRFERNEFKGRLLGHSGYACTPYLFTPILNPSSLKEEAYNSAHIHTHNTVESCFGVWKQRFRCLLRGFTTNLENTKLYIVALAILHNIAILHNETWEEEQTIAVENIESSLLIDSNNRGNALRARFIEENF